MPAAKRQKAAYHHGNLREALLAEAERRLESDGIPSLSLRAISRAAGVSHTAPVNHFGDLRGLLSELAAIGFHRFAAAVTSAVEAAGADPRARKLAMGRAYAGFASGYPGLFELMFRTECLDAERPAFRDARTAFAKSFQASVSEKPQIQSRANLQRVAHAIALWSLVHGFCVHLVDGRLKNMRKAFPDPYSDEDFFEAVFDAVILK